MDVKLEFPENLECEIIKVKTFQGVSLKVIKLAQFDFESLNRNIKRIQIEFPVNSMEYNKFISKIKNDDLTYQDYSSLDDLLNKFANDIFIIIQIK